MLGPSTHHLPPAKKKKELDRIPRVQKESVSIGRVLLLFSFLSTSFPRKKPEDSSFLPCQEVERRTTLRAHTRQSTWILKRESPSPSASSPRRTATTTRRSRARPAPAPLPTRSSTSTSPTTSPGGKVVRSLLLTPPPRPTFLPAGSSTATARKRSSSPVKRTVTAVPVSTVKSTTAKSSRSSSPGIPNTHLFLLPCPCLSPPPPPPSLTPSASCACACVLINAKLTRPSAPCRHCT